VHLLHNKHVHSVVKIKIRNMIIIVTNVHAVINALQEHLML